MVVCEYYRQGNCRYGQYCQFEHINNFGNTVELNREHKVDNEDETSMYTIMVAKEVLVAENSGQWLLSCFAPLRERPCIPGMEDVSPEEVRWEMYQAQKSGMVEQAKLHFQQLCQNMKAKRDALKNPTEETAAMLDKILGSGQKDGLNTSANTTGKSSTFSFAAPQLGLTNNTSTSNVFGNKAFSMQGNPFGGGFTSSANTSIFGRSNNSTAPTFGGGATFGNNLGFGTATNASSIFGGTTNASTFNSVQNTQEFGAVTPQSNPVFGGSSQGIFNQTNVFGTNQLGNAFARPQTSQSTTSAFDGSTSSSNSLFNNPLTSQSNTSLFGGAKTTTANLFGGSSSLHTNPVFGANASANSFNAGIFNQPKTLPAFGGAPVFGGTTNYSNNSGPMFGSQTFAARAIPANSIFGGSTVTTAPVFDLAQQSTNAFGTAVSASNVFGTQNTGAVISAQNTAPFGGTVTTINSPFATTSTQFESTNTSSIPFAGTGFGLPVASTSDTFGNTVTSSNPLFANARTTFTSSNATVSTNLSPFSTPAFSNVSSSPFSSTNTTITTTTTNPFAPRMQQNSMPFGNIKQNQVNSSITTSSFENSPFSSTSTAISTVIDDTVYTADNLLTDDEKSMYLAKKFIFGKIPLKPPTKDIR